MSIVADDYGIHAAPSTAYLPHDKNGEARHYRRMVSPKIQTLTERIAAKLIEHNLSEREASMDATGKPDAIRYIRTRNAMPSSERLESIAVTLHTTTSWLLGDDNAAAAVDGAPTVPLSDLKKMPRNLPIYGTALAADLDLLDIEGRPIAIEQTELNLSAPQDFVARPPSLAGMPHWYVVTVLGHSMEPRHDSGRRLLVNEKRPPRRGDDVVVQLRGPLDDGEEVLSVLVKRLVRQTSAGLVLHQFSPETDFVVPNEMVKCVHTVVPWEDVLGV